jgi:molybdopterin converting factor small subunit
MTINVEYFAQSRTSAGGKSRESIELHDGARLDDLLEKLIELHGEPMRHLVGDRATGRSAGLVVAVGGRQVVSKEDVPLRDGESVLLVPAISGG